MAPLRRAYPSEPSLRSRARRWLIAGVSFALSSGAFPVKSQEIGIGQGESLAESAGETSAQQPRLSPTETELRGWIEQLGASKFSEREHAADQLSRCDAGVIETLRAAADEATDPEVRSRCLVIVEAIYEADIGERSRNFLRSSNHTQDFGFEAWKPFSEITGVNRLSKRIFAEFARKFPNLADVDLSDRDKFRNRYREAVREIEVRRRQAMSSVIDSVALQFGAITLGEELPANHERLAVDLARSAPYSTFLGQTVYAKTLVALTGRWALTTRRDSEVVLQLALERNIASAIPKARQVLSRPKLEVTPDEFEMAVAFLVRFGSADDLRSLADWSRETRIHSRTEMRRPQVINFGNDNTVPPGGIPNPPLFGGVTIKTVEVLYQDIAIAGWLMLAKRNDIRDFFPYLQEHYIRAFVVDSLGFTEDERNDHAKMIDRWEAVAKDKL